MYEGTDYRYRVENLSSGETVEFDLPNPLRPLQLLPVPYVSQLDPGAETHRNDCGPAAAVMLMEAYTGESMTPDAFYAEFKIEGDAYVGAKDLRDALARKNVAVEWLANLGPADLFSFLCEKKPFIPLIHYSALSDAGLTESKFRGPHYLVVIGIDAGNIYVHDPLYRDRGGEAKAYPLEKFLEAWVDAGQAGNPERAALVPVSGLGQPGARRARVSASVLNVRAGPGTTYAVVGSLKKGEVVQVGLIVGQWGEIKDRRWIHLGYTVAA